MLTLQVFHRLNQDFSKFLNPYRIHLIEVAVQNLSALIPHYQKYCISTSDDKAVLPDEYDESLIFDGLINDIFEFLIKAVRHPTTKTLFVRASDDRELGCELLERLLASVTPLLQMPSVSVCHCASRM